MEVQNLCPGCMKHITEEQTHGGCPYCGYGSRNEEAVPPHILKPRTVLNGKYMIGRTLGEGGCGITYLGYDLNLEMRIAIKEYYPAGFVVRDTAQGNAVAAQEEKKRDFFEDGKRKIIHEARTLAKLSGLQGIVSVRDYFEENNTSYIIMEYLDGETLKGYLTRMGGRLSLPDVMAMMKPVLESLNEVHKDGMIHRDISPDNIMILKNGSMKLLDFGSARDLAHDREGGSSVMLKPGYAPEEQYRVHGVQGTWTDVYAVCATIYKCLTGVTPVDALTRIGQDTLVPPSSYGVMIAPAQEAALLKGMAVYSQQRFRTLGEFYQAFYCLSMPQLQPMAQTQPMPQTQPMAQAAVQGSPQRTVYRLGQGASHAGGPRRKVSGLSVAIGIAAAVAAVLIGIAVWIFTAGAGRTGGSQGAQEAEGESGWRQEDGMQAQAGQPTGEDSSTDDGQSGTEDGMRGLSQSLGEDASGLHGVPTLCYDLPEGFTELTDGMYYSPDFPNDYANINIITTEHDTLTFQYTEETFCEAVEELYHTEFGLQVEIDCSEFTRTTVNGCNALIIRTSYVLEDVAIEQIQYSVETQKDKVTTVTFTQYAGGGWTEEFNKVLDTMRIEYR